MIVKSCEKVEKSQVALTIEIGAEEFEAALQKAYLKKRKNIRVDGFRAGKAPRKMIEAMYGADVFYNDAIDIAFPEAYEAAVKEQELNIVGYPAVELVGDINKEVGFTVKAIIPVYPEVTLGEYKGLSLEKEEVKASAADVNARLKSMQERNSRLVSVEREAKKGDTAVIDFEGFLDGVPFEGGKGENHSLELGSGAFVPGFEEQVVGMKAGEEKEIDITFPEDYHAELAGKAVVFKVKCNEVKVKEVPELDDEFAKDVSEFDTLKELKADLKKQILAEKQKAADESFKDALLDLAAANTNVEIPDAMIEAQARQYVENFKARLMQNGITFENYAKMTGMDEEKMMAEGKEPAERQVRLDLTLAAIIKAEGFEASEEEVEAEYAKTAAEYDMEVDMVKKYVNEAQIKDQIVTNKAIAAVVDSAVVIKPEKKTKKAAEVEAEAENAAE